MVSKLKMYLAIGLVSAAVIFGITITVLYVRASNALDIAISENAALTITNKVLVDANKGLSDALELTDRSKDITDTITEHLIEQTQQINKQFAGLRTLTQKKYSEIEAKYASMEDTPENRDAKRIDIGLERARGVWRMYCIAEPAALECAE